MIEAVIFDLDGVLATTDTLHFAAWKRLADELCITGYAKADNLRQRGVGRMESLEVLLEKSSVTYTQAEKEALAERKNDYYVALLSGLGPEVILPGAENTLQTLRRRGIKLAVGSASKNACQILTQCGLAAYFDAIATGYDVTKSKPDPAIFLAAADKLNVSPECCIVVEDAEAGIDAGNAGGMITLGVGPASAYEPAAYRATSLADPALDWDRLLC